MATKAPATKKAAPKKAAPKKPVPKVTLDSVMESGWEDATPGRRFRERPLGSPIQPKFDALVFGGPGPADPGEAIGVLSARIDQVITKELRVRKFHRFVGAAWGKRVCDALGWIAVDLRDDEARTFRLNIVSPDRRLYIRLHELGVRALSSAAANNVALLSSMLRDGAPLPPATPGAYVELG